MNLTEQLRPSPDHLKAIRGHLAHLLSITEHLDMDDFREAAASRKHWAWLAGRTIHHRARALLESLYPPDPDSERIPQLGPRVHLWTFEVAAGMARLDGTIKGLIASWKAPDLPEGESPWSLSGYAKGEVIPPVIEARDRRALIYSAGMLEHGARWYERYRAEEIGEPGEGDQDQDEQLVTLEQISLASGKTVRHLRRFIDDDTMPPAASEGRGSRAALWRWGTIRPWLVEEFKMKIERRIPSPEP